jgi:hypothetical protein
MRSARIAIVGALAAGGAAAGLGGCGGDEAGAVPTVDASIVEAGGSDVTVVEAAGDEPIVLDDAAADDGGGCAPPSDPTRAALCVTLTAETVQFLPNDPHFDGKGLLLVAVQGAAMPDGGASVATPVILPDPDAGDDAGLIDLSQRLPSVRIDGVPPGTVYPQAIFIDDPAAGLKTPGPGWWLGGYDYSNGLQSAPLMPVTLQAGASATVSLNLRALRGLSLQVSTSVAPAGNGQGPLKVLIIEGNSVADSGTRAWGYGTAACADCVADGGANVVAFFIGPGPYYTLPVLDDFGLGGSFPPGAMTSLDTDAGLTIPAANEFSAGNAYVFAQAVNLNYVSPAPDGGIDEASCP